MRTLTLRCKQKPCNVTVKLDWPDDEKAPTFRIVHEDDGTHKLQRFVMPELAEGEQAKWDKVTWG